jgi:hypothetical protein
VTTARLENWCVISNPYTAPELSPQRLCGTVYGHPRKEDGKKVTTSRVASVDGRTITTESGTVYVLGHIDPDYRKFLREHVPSWDWRNPIKITKSESSDAHEEERRSP